MSRSIVLVAVSPQIEFADGGSRSRQQSNELVDVSMGCIQTGEQGDASALFENRLGNTASEIQPGGQFSTDCDFAGHEISRRHNFVERDLDLNRFTRANHSLEFGTINASGDRDRPIVGRKLTEQNRTALQTAFAQDHAGHEWKAWEVTL